MKKLILRTCNKDMKSFGGFVWPESGEVSAPDWSPTETCGNGLHGLLWGQGDGSLLNWDKNAKWLVAEVDGHIVDLGGKVKFQKATVLHCGDRASATSFIIANGANGPVVGSTVTGGDRSTVTGGDRSTVTGGDRSTVTGGNGSTVTGGNGSIVTGGDRSIVTGGDGSTVTGGDRSTVTGGNGSTVTGGNGSTVTGGNGSTVTGGDRSTVTGGDRSTVTGGDGSVLMFRFWDGTQNRHRYTIAYVGEKGIKPNTKYILNNKNKPEEVGEESP